MVNYVIVICPIVFISILALYLFLENIKLKKLSKNYSQCKIKIPDVPIGIYMKDLNNRVLDSNNEFANIAGYKKSELVNKTLEEIFSHEDWASARLRDNEALKTKSTIRLVRTVVNNNDELHHYRILKCPMFNDNGEIEGFLVCMSNIDNEIKQENAKNNFIATLMHDLKTPTTAQLNMINLLLKGSFGDLNPEQKEMLSLTSCSCKYMADLVATIVDSYKCDCHKLNLNCKEFDILVLIQALCKGLKSLAEERKQEIFINTDNTKNEYLIYADRLQIKRVIVNFLSNAINYGFKNTNIIINLTQKNDIIDFSVESKSKFINEEQIKNIFNKFTNTERSLTNKASTGLGLYLSKQIIDLHNGEIYAKSFEDGTCLFGFKLNTKTIQQNLENAETLT